MPIINFQSVANKDPFVIPERLKNAEPATGANYGVYFIAEFPCEVMEFAAAWETASSSGTLNVEKLTGTQALDNGVTLLSTNISTSGTANTTNYGTMVLGTTKQLARGDRLALKDGGTLTSSAGLSTTTVIKPLGKGHYQMHGVSFT